MGNRMCKFKDTKLCFQEDFSQWDETYREALCPSNTNSKCEIVAKKRKHIDWKISIDKTVKSITPKKKMVRVKAGAWFDDGFLHTTSDQSWKKDIAYIPCTILIDAKWLKGEK